MNFLRDCSVLVLGLGESGLAMARWCARQGATVQVWDSRENAPHAETLRAELPQLSLSHAPLGDAVPAGVTLVLKSPGLAPHDERIAPLLAAARATGIAVMAELDLFMQALADLKEQTAQAARDERAAALQTEREAAAHVATAAADAAVEAESRLETEAEAEAEAEAETEPGPVDSTGTEASTDREDGVEGAAEASADPADPADPADVPAPLAVTAEVESDDAASDATAAPVVAPPPPPDPGYAPQVVAITGTNGKTTTTAMAGLLIERSGVRVGVAGNISPTMLDRLTAMLALPREEWVQVWVLELSSFQLADAGPFEPSAAVVLNVSQDHLDWHGGMPPYLAAKARVFGRGATMIVNRDDAQVEAMVPAPVVTKVGRGKPVVTQRRVLRFGLNAPERPGDFGLVTEHGMAWLVRAMPVDETLKRRKDEEDEIHLQRMMPADALRVRGRHNAANALAALALATAIGRPLAPMLHGLREYAGEPHRVEWIGTVGGIEAFDDTKGTNVGATVAALEGLGADKSPHRLVVILGGDGKGQDFTPLAGPVQRHARAVALIGRDADSIAAALAETDVPMRRHATLPEAVNWCFEQAQEGDAVLLSPACASLDMFRNYVHRGEVFVDAVRALAADRGEAV
jgi:UDP-N-acetylmuramoylalanine--D-glutamate ligase